jgi:hypothetical protein
VHQVRQYGKHFKVSTFCEHPFYLRPFRLTITNGQHKKASSNNLSAVQILDGVQLECEQLIASMTGDQFVHAQHLSPIHGIDCFALRALNCSS